ncbi:amidohydrolase family protein [Gordonia sp. NPDC003376]
MSAQTVDCHSHFAPAGVLTNAARHGFGFAYDDGWLETAAGRLPAHYPELIDPQSKLDRMDALGIEHAVVSLTPHLFVYESNRHSAVFASLANDELAAFVSTDDRLSGAMALPIADPDASLRELRRCRSHGFRAVHVGTNTPDGRGLIGRTYDPVFEELVAEGLPLMLHPYYCGAFQEPEYFLHNSLGVPFDTTVAYARMAASGVFDRHPTLTVVLAHGGGFLPYQLGRLDHAWCSRPDLQQTSLHPPSEYLDRIYCDTVVHGARSLRFLVDTIGVDHLVLGTDSPYATGDTTPIQSVVAAGLEPRRLADVATRLFDLAATATRSR